jgi:hypothetical protein
VTVKPLLALILTFVLALTGAVLATTSQARKMQWFVCGSNSVKIRSAPWTMGIKDPIGVRIKHGTRYFLRAGSAGPSCTVARKKLAQIARLRTRKAIRAASFGGLHCDVDVGQYDPHVLWVRPLGAWAGCWTFCQPDPLRALLLLGAELQLKNLCVTQQVKDKMKDPARVAVALNSR